MTTFTQDHDPEVSKELEALVRLLSYARQTSVTLDREFTTYCLDLALASIFEDLQDSELNAPTATRPDRCDDAESLH